MSRKIAFTVTITLLFVLVSCVLDTVPIMWIINRTCDTIIIGRAYYDNIDSIKYLITNLEVDTTELKLKIKEDLEIKRDNIIVPDSFATDDARIYSGQNSKGYFFIFNYNSIKTHSWDEICKNHLYDTLVITQEMLEQGNRIEYHGGKKSQENHTSCEHYSLKALECSE